MCSNISADDRAAAGAEKRVAGVMALDEKKLLDQMLYQLRMQNVEIAQRASQM